jgi:Protein of unknown function (DUF3300)
MTKALKFLAALLFALPLFAQAQVPRAASPNYSQPELDQMLAPIALYPDALLSQVLMAATYPTEVVEAARWTRANGGLQGDAAVRSAQGENWDSSVISLVAFPQILQRMEENPDWTRALGDAFLAQEPQVMDSVQQLRQRAQAAGNLQSSEQMYVQQQGQTIVLQPASPEYVYVPYYDPYVVYGPWWWPAYRPVYWAPWHGYARAYRPGLSVGFWWGAPVRLSQNFFFGNLDWRRRQARVVYPHAYYYRAAVPANRTLAVAPQRRQNDPQRSAAFSGRSAMPAQPAAAAQARPAATVRAQPQASPAIQQRVERREERQAARANAPAAVAPQSRMPAASAPQQPRAERPEPRHEHREQRREERGQKS